MRKSIAILALSISGAIASAPVAGAQNLVPDWEIFGGYSFTHWGSGSLLLPTYNANGWDISAGENANRWLGGIFDVSGAYSNSSAEGVRVNGSAYPFLFGPQFTLRKFGGINLFGRPMIGGVHARENVPGGTIPISQTKWAYSLGGGVDVKLSRHVSARFSADWVRSHFPVTVARDYQNSVRVSAGLLFGVGTRSE